VKSELEAERTELWKFLEKMELKGSEKREKCPKLLGLG